MDVQQLRKIESLYKKSDQLLKSGRFGDGLWPLDPGVGQFLALFIEQFRLKNGMEIGAGVGYSTGWLVAGLQVNGGKLTCFEYFLPKVAQLEEHLEYLFGSKYEEVAEVIPTDVEKWLVKKGRKKFDFVFFDQRKGDYLRHLQLILPRLKRGAFITADNVTSHAAECAEYLRFMKTDKRFRSVTLALGQGLEISRYLG